MQTTRIPTALVYLSTALLGTSLVAATQESARAVALERATELEAETARLSDRLWNLSETALRETESAELLATVLEEAGFEVQRGVAGMPTAFE